MARALGIRTEIIYALSFALARVLIAGVNLYLLGTIVNVLLGWPLWLGLGLAAAQVLWHYRLIRTRTRAGCFVAFSKSHWIGAAIFAGVALGFALR